MRFDVFFGQNKNKVLSEFHIFSSSDDKGDEEEMKKWLATKTPEYAYSSAYIERDTYKKYKDLFEAKILESPYWTVKYVTDVLNGIRAVTHKPHKRWPKGESVIAKDPYASWLYARYIIYGRWPEGEKAIFDSEDPQYKDIYLDFLNSIGYQDEDNQEISFESYFTEAKKKVVFTPVNFPNGIDFGKYNFGKGGHDFEQLNDINDLQSALHSTTYERLIEIKNKYDAEWTGLIKFKNANTKKTSFIIFGKVNKDVKGNKLSSPEDVAYYRKETSDYGIGTTSIYFKDRVYPVNNFLEFTNLDTPKKIVEYARKVTKGRVPKNLEDIIATDARASINYAKVIKERFPAGEKQILNDLYSANVYADEVIKGRWPEAEPLIANDGAAAVTYAKNVLKKRWTDVPDIPKDKAKEIEDRIRDYQFVFQPFSYARDVIQGRWEDFEHRIVNDPFQAYEYAVYAVKDRWPAGEPAIFSAEYTKNAYLDFLKKQGYEDEDNEEQDEDVITRPLFEEEGNVDLDKCVTYAVKEGKRWPELEKFIIDYKYIYRGIVYAEHVLKGRWLELERLLDDIKRFTATSAFKAQYLDMLKDIGYQDEDNEEQDDVINDDLITAIYRSGKEVVQLDDCLDYAAKIGKRWPKLEQYILYLNFPSYGIEYAKRVIKGRWIELENYLKKFYDKNSHYLDEYLRVLKDLGYEDEDNEEITQESISSLTASEAYALAKTRHREDPSIKRFPELEKIILTNSYYSTLYAGDVLGERWPEAEPLIAKNAYAAYVYAVNVIKGRWSQGEPAIFDSEYKDDYLKFLQDLGYEDEDNEEQDVITRPLIHDGTGDVDIEACLVHAERRNKRWPELEKIILNSREFHSAIIYAELVIKGRWLEFENKLNNPSFSSTFYKERYEKMLKEIGYEDEDNEELSFESFFSEAKSKVRPPTQDELEDPLSAAIYASQVLGGRWKEKEDLIASKALSAFQYAIQVLKDRWINIPDISKNIAEFAEGAIRKSSMYSVPYAEQIIKDRWPELEKDILDFRKNVTAVNYASHVLKRRWPEAEPFIMKWNDTKEDYINFLNEIGYQDEDNEEQDVIDNPLFLIKDVNGVQTVDNYRCLQYAIEQGKRWPEFEKHIIESRKYAAGVQYAKDVLKGRWPALEVLLKHLPYLQHVYIDNLNQIGYEDEDNEELSFESFFSDGTKIPSTPEEVYAMAKELGERLPEYEHIILNDKSPDAPYWAYEYLKKIINKNAASDYDRVTWPEAEPVLARDGDIAYRYALYYLNAKYWDDEEYDYTPLTRFPLGEPQIAKDTHSAGRYARHILKGRWPEGEEAIFKDNFEKKKYIEFLNAIGYQDEDNEELSFESFFTEAKKKVRPPTKDELTDPLFAYIYALSVLKGQRFPEGEPVIAKDPHIAFKYARDVIKNRWPEGEEAIFSNPHFKHFYVEFLNDIEHPEDEDNEEL